MKIWIDADGCPVVSQTLDMAKKFQIEAVIVCDTSHEIKREGVRTITVSKGTDSVDFALVNQVQPKDIVVTQDYGLAAMALARQSVPISQDGLVFTDSNIDALLLSRHTARKIRMAGGRLKGSAKRVSAQDTQFTEALQNLIIQLQGD